MATWPHTVQNFKSTPLLTERMQIALQLLKIVGCLVELSKLHIDPLIIKNYTLTPNFLKIIDFFLWHSEIQPHMIFSFWFPISFPSSFFLNCLMKNYKLKWECKMGCLTIPDTKYSQTSLSKIKQQISFDDFKLQSRTTSKILHIGAVVQILQSNVIIKFSNTK